MKKIMFIVAVAAGFSGNTFALDNAIGSLKAAVPPSIADAIAVPAPTAVDVSGVEKGSVDSLAELKAAVKAADIDEVTRFGRSFWIKTYPKNTAFKTIVADAVGYDESDVDLRHFRRASGDAAARAFAKSLRDEAKAEAEDADEVNSPRLVRAIADAAEKAFTGTRNFSDVQLAEHAIAEDGDLESHTMVGQQKDGSLFVLVFTNFPF